jgi:hypothetical protein
MNLILETLMANSQWLTDILNAIKTIFNGSSGQEATDKAVADLTTRLNSDEATEAEQATAIASLVAALAAAPPATGTPPVVTA